MNIVKYENLSLDFYSIMIQSSSFYESTDMRLMLDHLMS